MVKAQGNIQIGIGITTADAEEKIKGVSDKVDGLGKKSKTSSLGITEFNSALAIAEKVIQGAGQVLDQTVGAWSEYAEAMGKAAKNAGVSSEEMSRLTQAADDFRVEQSVLESAMALALKNGFVPTIVNIAKLSDEYLAIKDPAERAEFASKTFGRSYVEIVPMLMQGGDAIRAGTAAIADNLVVTEKAIRENEKYIAAQDNLADSWQGLKNSAGEFLIPYATALLEGAVAGDNFWEMMKRIHDETKKIEPAIEAATDRWQGLADAYERTTTAVEAEVTAEKQLASDALTARQKAYVQAVKDGRIEIQKYTDELGHELRTMDELKIFMAGPLGNEIESFNGKQEDLAKAAKDVQAEIDLLEKKRYLTTEQKEALGELKSKLGDIQDQVVANADAHDEATKRILFDMMQQQMAVDGLSQKEQDVLWEISKNWGLIDQATYDAWMGMKEYTGAIDDAALPADILARKIALLQDKHIWITTTYVDEYVKALQTGAGEPVAHSGDQTDYDSPTAPVTVAPVISVPAVPYHNRGEDDYAAGGSFQVPPGYLNDSYPLGPGKWASSGEMVTISPTFQITQQPGQDGAALADMVMQRLSELTRRARMSGARYMGG